MICQATKLFEHQKRGIDFIVNRGGSGALFWEMGLGKTLAGLETFSVLKGKNPSLKLLVVCPFSLIDGAWGKDIKSFTDFTYCNLRESVTEADIYIVNFEWVLSPSHLSIIRSMCKLNDFMCIIDESSRMKNYKAKTTKTLLNLRNFFKHRIVMSGTPAPNNEMEYWAQLNFVHPGLFFESFYQFRNYYFHLARGNQKMQLHGQIVTRDMAREMFSRGWEYSITDQKRKELFERMAPHIHQAKKKDCMDLPDQVDEFRAIDLSPEQRRIYKSMKNDLIAEINGKGIVAQVALTKLMKLRQITSGFAITPDGEPMELKNNPKLDELENLLEEAGPRHQAIIWCQFHKEIWDLTKVLGERCVTLYGDTTDKMDSIDKFRNGKAQYLIAHPRSAAHGLTFINASLQIFYSLDFSWESYEQARARTHRAGQINKCTYIHLIARDSIDEHILKVLKEKRNAVEILTCLN